MKMKYKINEITPQAMRCLVVSSCPAIYEGLRELTLPEICVSISCPSTYEARREGEDVYLIIGRQVNPTDAGLEKRVREGEVLIEVPKALIDNKRK